MHPVTRVVPSIEVGTTSTGDFVSHDHRISQSFKCVAQLVEAIEPNQQAPELVFPTEQPLDRIEPLFEDGEIEQRLAASLWCFAATGVWIDVGNHPQIENGLAVRAAVIDAIQTDNASVKVEANGPGDAPQLWKAFAKQWGFISVARCRNKRRDHIPVVAAAGDGLVALHFLVPAEANVVAALFRCRRRAIAVNDRDVEEVVLMKPQHRACKNGVHTAIGIPPPEGAINARVVNFRTTFAIFFDRQLLPLTPHVERKHLATTVHFFLDVTVRCTTCYLL